MCSAWQLFLCLCGRCVFYVVDGGLRGSCVYIVCGSCVCCQCGSYVLSAWKFVVVCVVDVW